MLTLVKYDHSYLISKLNHMFQYSSNDNEVRNFAKSLIKEEDDKCVTKFVRDKSKRPTSNFQNRNLDIDLAKFRV
jgi:hypothetical protein